MAKIKKRPELAKVLAEIRSIANARTSSHAWDCHCSICKIYELADEALGKNPKWGIEDKLKEET